ncbi:hypothetical protein AWC38_SpisGene23429 [Stylophora pistillata]|uniref:DUF5641 domain-containing protein n=1 Tax=Stylophora pistillata TaxID=50429 RepID=A0A2B4R5Z9_STYPI|nr:hypothetical protein AWC38_SpisGene23429 [Stylophora pistillata]
MCIMLEDGEIHAECESHNEYEARIMESMAKMRCYLASKHVSEVSLAGSSPPASQSSFQVQVKLPKINLPTFGRCPRTRVCEKFNSETFVPVLVPLIVDKLPKEVVERWELELSEEKAEQDCVKVKTLFAFLEQLIRAKESSQPPSLDSKTPAKGNPGNREKLFKFNTSQKSSTSALCATTQESKCVICYKNHGWKSCLSFLSFPVKERFRKATSKGLCFRCLESGHRAEVCQTPPASTAEEDINVLHQDSARPHFLWTQGVGWDEEVPVEVSLKRNQWVQELLELEHLHIPRCYIDLPLSQNPKVELHAFGDASEVAYASVPHLRVAREDGKASTSLVISKTRVAPVRKITLPRLELMAAVITARLGTYVKGAIDCPISRIVCWTDNSSTLHWIRGAASQWKPFVANRVIEIQSLLDPGVWRYCPGPQNPADLPTRGLSASQFGESLLWWKGPSWLQESEKDWHEDLRSKPCNEIVDQERKSKASVNCIVQPKEPYIDFTRFSKYSRLLRTVAWIKRFVSNSRVKEYERIDSILTEQTSRPLTKRFQYHQRLINGFWKRWHAAYLKYLTPLKKWHKSGREIRKGDLVLVSEDRLARGQWSRARVEDTITGRDGLVRSVTLRTSSGSVTRRPVQWLHLFEACDADLAAELN